LYRFTLQAAWSVDVGFPKRDFGRSRAALLKRGLRQPDGNRSDGLPRLCIE
jgi:hypothetical protein